MGLYFDHQWIRPIPFDHQGLVNPRQRNAVERDVNDDTSNCQNGSRGLG
jgi:hypothetical protein